MYKLYLKMTIYGYNEPCYKAIDMYMGSQGCEIS